jgi:hypothetical protein
MSEIKRILVADVPGGAATIENVMGPGWRALGTNSPVGYISQA